MDKMNSQDLFKYIGEYIKINKPNIIENYIFKKN